MKLPDHFKNKDTLTAVIDDYFTLVLNDDKKAAPPTVAGLALHLGFNSKDDFDIYETKGRFAGLIKRARFKVMAYYETRLHYPAPTGAMFALKCMGWHEKIKVRKATSKAKTIKVKLVESGPEPASSEKDINLNKQ